MHSAQCIVLVELVNGWQIINAYGNLIGIINGRDVMPVVVTESIFGWNVTLNTEWITITQIAGHNNLFACEGKKKDKLITFLNFLFFFKFGAKLVSFTILPFLCAVRSKWLENRPVQQRSKSHPAFRTFGIQSGAQDTFRPGIRVLWRKKCGVFSSF